jgi:hypothetical protein
MVRVFPLIEPFGQFRQFHRAVPADLFIFHLHRSSAGLRPAGPAGGLPRGRPSSAHRDASA